MTAGGVRSERDQFAADVRRGLGQPQKRLDSKYLYDDLGSALFEAITELPEYGLTRADSRLIKKAAPELAARFDGAAAVAEVGSGSGAKTRLLLEAFAARQPVSYYPIDLSAAALERCRRELGAIAAVEPLHASYLPGLREVSRDQRPLLLLMLGSNIGNFDRLASREFLQDVRRRLRPGDGLLIGTDLVKPVETMLAAYDDPTGVTAAFNLNLLGRINRELDGDFDLRSFAHQARYDARHERVEMHLRSLEPQTARVKAAGIECRLEAGETIWTESSHKYRLESLPGMAEEAGFRPERVWVDEEWPFAESLWMAA